MVTPGIEEGRINIGEYADRLPESQLLANLAAAAASGRNPHYEDWWQDLRTEHEAGTLPADAAVAAYYRVMHPVDMDKALETDGPENARALKAGEKVVGLTFSGDFCADIHGKLDADAVALFGHPSNPSNVDYSSVRLGLSFADRKGMLPVEAAIPMAIGEDAVVGAYRDFLKKLAFHRNSTHKFNAIHSKSLRATAIMQRLGLIDADPSFVGIKDELLAKGASVVTPDGAFRLRRDYYSQGAMNLHILSHIPDLHVLDPEAGEERIQAFAAHDYLTGYQSELVAAIAKVRSPYVYDSLSAREQSMWRHKASAEVLEISFNAEEARQVEDGNVIVLR